MPKPPPIEYILFKVPCPAAVLGELIVAASKLGLNEYETEVVTAIPAFAKRANHETSAADMLVEWIKDNPTFKAIDAVKHLESLGRTKGSTYPALGLLIEKKVLRKLGPGHYARADIRQLEGPKKAKKEKKEKAAGVRKEITNAEFTLRYARKNHGRFNTAKLREKFEQDGRQPASSNRAIAELMERKQVKRVGEGEYVLLAKGAKDKPEPKPSNTPTETQEVTNG